MKSNAQFRQCEMNIDCTLHVYSVYRFRCINLRLSNAHGLFSAVFISCPVIITLAHTLSLEPKPSFVARSIATWHGYLNSLCLSFVMLEILMSHFNPWALYISEAKFRGHLAPFVLRLRIQARGWVLECFNTAVVCWFHVVLPKVFWTSRHCRDGIQAFVRSPVLPTIVRFLYT